ncbi:MAG TPA: hypothetical protein DCO79_14765 [Spirochaeta sp.]|nr:hypothetical protein [Spirochaeta sp.]
MLHEVKNVIQEDVGFRRTFIGDYFDLFIWYESQGGKLKGFELCYDKTAYERSIIWRVNQGYLHSKVDSGEGMPGRAKQTPVLLADGVFENESIAGKFKLNSTEIDSKIAEMVYGKLIEYTI